MKKISSLMAMLMMVGVASAAIVGAGILLSGTGYGMYTDEVPGIGYQVVDPDPSDDIQLEYMPDSNVMSFFFPVWVGETVEYRDAVGFIPDSDGNLTISGVGYLPGNIVSMRAQLTDRVEYAYMEKIYNVNDQVVDITVPVSEGVQYNFSFMLVTGSDGNNPEAMTFRVKKTE